MTMCERCGKNPAVIHLTRITQAGRAEVHLCMQCATGMVKVSQHKAQAQNTIDKTFARQMNEMGPVALRCEGCGYTVEDIRKTGRMGCARCYETFEDMIEPTLKALGKKAGSIPPVRDAAAREGKEKDARIQSLRQQMKDAVGREEYEAAARLRDEIKTLESR